MISDQKPGDALKALQEKNRITQERLTSGERTGNDVSMPARTYSASYKEFNDTVAALSPLFPQSGVTREFMIANGYLDVEKERALFEKDIQEKKNKDIERSKKLEELTKEEKKLEDSLNNFCENINRRLLNTENMYGAFSSQAIEAQDRREKYERDKTQQLENIRKEIKALGGKTSEEYREEAKRKLERLAEERRRERAIIDNEKRQVQLKEEKKQIRIGSMGIVLQLLIVTIALYLYSLLRYNSVEELPDNFAHLAKVFEFFIGLPSFLLVISPVGIPALLIGIIGAVFQRKALSEVAIGFTGILIISCIVFLSIDNLDISTIVGGLIIFTLSAIPGILVIIIATNISKK